MLVLGQKKEPLKIVLKEAVAGGKGRKAGPEAFVVMAPITSAMRRRAAAVARRIIGDVDDAAELTFDQVLDYNEAYAMELVRLGVAEWGGLGDAAGNPLALTPDRETRLATAAEQERPTGTVDLLLADEDLADLIAARYAAPDMRRQAEKNGSAASPSGTGKAATRGRTTAGSRAGSKARTSAAKGARTASTRSRAKKAK